MNCITNELEVVVGHALETMRGRVITKNENISLYARFMTRGKETAVPIVGFVARVKRNEVRCVYLCCMMSNCGTDESIQVNVCSFTWPCGHAHKDVCERRIAAVVHKKQACYWMREVGKLLQRIRLFDPNIYLISKSPSRLAPTLCIFCMRTRLLRPWEVSFRDMFV